MSSGNELLTDYVPTTTLGWRIRMSMEHAGYSQDELAKLLDVSSRTVFRWAHDEFRPKNAWVRAIALACGVQYDWLRGGDSNSQPNGTGLIPAHAA